MTPEQFAKKYLTPPVAKRYINNVKLWNKRLDGIRRVKCGRNFSYHIIADFIMDGFSWMDSVEGDSYWSDIHRKIRIRRR